MKIKYQQGGMFVPPFAVYQPFMIPTADEPASVKNSSGGDNGIDMKDVYNLVKDLDGLPGDVSRVTHTMQQLFQSIEHKLSNPAMFGGTNSIAVEYMQLLSLTNDLKFQKDRYNKAYDTAVSKGNIHEAAINAKGQIMVLTEEGPDWIYPEEYAKNQKKYHVVTNQELLNFRAQGQGGLAFDISSITTVSNGMGIEEVTNLIDKAVNNLGKDTNGSEGYASSKSLLRGLQEYIKAKEKSGNHRASIDDLYKGNLLSESSAKQAKRALRFIESSLPVTAISLLKMKSDGTAYGAAQLIEDFVTSKLSTKIDFDIDQESSKGSSSDSSSSDKGTIKQSFITEVQAGRGAHKGRFKLNNRSNNMLATDTDVYEGVLNLDGKYQENPTSMDLLLKKSGLASIAIEDQMQLGNQQISQRDMQDILYTGGAFARAELPIIPGTKKVNFELLDKLDEFEARIKSLGENPEELLEDEQFKDLKPYFKNGKRTEYFAPFLLFDVTTSEGLIGINKDNKFVYDAGDDPDLQSDIMYYLSEANPENPNKYKDLDWNDWKDLGNSDWYDHIYKATLFIPIDMNKQAAIIGGGQTPKFGETWAEQEYQQAQKGYNQISINNLIN